MMTEYDRGRAAGLAEAVKVVQDLPVLLYLADASDADKKANSAARAGQLHAKAEAEIALRALSTSPGEYVLVKRDELSEWSKCLHDVASGKGGWAWEDVFYEMSDRAMLSAKE